MPRAPVEGSEERISVVHSSGCAALRYAAIGFLANADEEAAIATDEAYVAAGRSQAVGAGIAMARIFMFAFRQAVFLVKSGSGALNLLSGHIEGVLAAYEETLRPTG
ncbi:hypothetical protein N7G274_006933 [Stereocaulon virgatum]|uniref:Uncharacterized protein n=1 Tax=Stereocaulon virgatum TaxID=373712 RepID=A0ABR4A3Q3_9LECA